MKRIGILSSHNGSGLDTILKACEDKNLNAQVILVISNNSTAKVLEKAERNNIPNFIINNKKYPNETSTMNVDEKITNLMKEFKVDYIFLSGYMKKIEKNLINTFKNKIINSHPSLLPKFGGVGMYGSYVHEAVIKAKENETGCTIHFVNEHYDEGEYILQKKLLLEKNETVNSLEKKIKNLESKTIIEALQKLINN